MIDGRIQAIEDFRWSRCDGGNDPLGGVPSGAVIGVLTVIVLTDLTAGTGRFNLSRGTVGAMTGIAASLSTVMTGYLFQGFGRTIGFIVIAAIAGSATILLWFFLAETKPAKYSE
jgi:sugar phosphate permease